MQNHLLNIGSIMRNLLEQPEEDINFATLETLFKNVLDLFSQAYIKMTDDMPFQYQREDNLNDKLYKCLVIVLEEQGIENLCPIPQNYDPRQRETHGQASQVDFLVRWTLDVKKDKYQFYIECKLLRCNGKNREYYNNGIRRFETNRYAKDLPFAAMIGYIERGEVPTIVPDLNQKIRDTATRNLIKVGEYWESIHRRDSGNANIRLYHLFFDFRDCQNNPSTISPCPNNRGIKSLL